jgi:hypothetical protein
VVVSRDYCHGRSLRLLKIKSKKIKNKKLDNTKNISTFAIPNTGSYQTEFDNGIKERLKR